MAYFLLFSRVGALGRWNLEFGAYDRSDVASERDSLRDQGFRASNLKIVKIANARQRTVDAAFAGMNAGA
jgi:hypothetical protein